MEPAIALSEVIRQFLPELALVGTALLLLLSEVGYHRERFRLISGVASLGFLTAIVLSLARFPAESSQTLLGFFTFDSYGALFRLLFEFLGLGVVISAGSSLEVARERHAEFLIFVCVAVVSASFMVFANHLLVVLVAAQTLGFSIQFLVSFQKRSVLSVEAGLKAWSSQWLGTIFFLVAIAMFYSAFHRLDLSGIRDVARMGAGGDLAWMGFAFLSLAVFAWMGLFPFHAWGPDATTGMPVPALGIVLWLGPAAGGAFLLRFFAHAGQWIQNVEGSIPLLSVYPIISAGVASVSAGQQGSFKRTLAFLCAARWGLWVAVLPELNSDMFSGVLLIAVTELPALAGVIYSLGLLRDRYGTSDLGQMAGAARKFLPESFALLFFLAAALGLPPFPGFLGNYVLLTGLFHHGADWLAWAGLVVLGVSWLVFLRIGLIFSREKRGDDVPIGRISGVLGRAYLLILVLPIVMIGIYADVFLKWVSQIVFPSVW